MKPWASEMARPGWPFGAVADPITLYGTVLHYAKRLFYDTFVPLISGAK